MRSNNVDDTPDATALLDGIPFLIGFGSLCIEMSCYPGTYNDKKTSRLVTDSNLISILRSLILILGDKKEVKI